MDLRNQSRLEVAYQSASPDLQPDLVVTQVVGKVLGGWDPSSVWALDWDAAPALLRDRSSTPWGDLCPDFHHLKAGCDLTVNGQVYSPEPKGSKEIEVQAWVGPERRSLRVFGPRRWISNSRGELIPSPPERFGILGMAWNHSFGGACKNAKGDHESYLFNPEGRGYQTCPLQAKGELLPQIEDPSQLICEFEDRPRPINLSAIPAHCAMNLYPDPTPMGQALLAKERIKLDPAFHNVAHPCFRYTNVPPGVRFGVEGMHPSGPLCGQVPERRFRVDVRLGERKHVCWLEPSSIVIFPETRQASITYSTHFAFQWVPHERREIKIYAIDNSGVRIR